MSQTIPVDVPEDQKDSYISNMKAITRDTGRLAMFSADQKIEHLNPIHPDTLFTIASRGNIGAFATHLGLIHRYAPEYENIDYIVKMDGKSNLRTTNYEDPYSQALWSIDHVIHTREEGNIPIRGIGYTVYLGSAYEAWMLAEAATLVYHAHQEGLIAIIWMYPRGEAIHDEADPELICGATAAATSIATDFTKVKVPRGTPEQSAHHISDAVTSSGNTGVICSGGPREDAHQFLYRLHSQIHTGNSSGCAVGRNIFTRGIEDGIAMTHAISAIVYEDYHYEEAYNLL